MESPAFTPIFAIVALAFFTTLALVPLIKIIAQKFGFVSRIDSLRQELAPRPRLGGVAIFLSVTLANALVGGTTLFPLSFILPGLGLVALGVIVDKLRLSTQFRLVGELACIALWLFLTPQKDLLLVHVGLDPWLGQIGHAFFVIGVLHAIRLIDGMDGLASGTAAISFSFLGWLMLPNLQLAMFTWSVGAACFAHLIFNRPPASNFLGESGSLLLGFWLSTSASEYHPVALNIIGFLVPLFVLAYPIINSLFARKDKTQLHHRLRRFGLGPYGALGVAWFTTCFCGVAAVTIHLIIHNSNNEPQSSSWISFLVAVLSISGLGALLTAITFGERRLGTLLAQIGTPMLHRLVRTSPGPSWPDQPYNAVVFDLLPYYKELQERGVSDLSAFLNEFAAWINANFADRQQLVPAGAYSLLVISTEQINKNALTNSFKGIIANHNIALSSGSDSSPAPWGLLFFSDPIETKEFERKYGLFLRSRRFELTDEQAS